MEKYNDKLAEEDEEFVLCQICYLNFDEKEHVPKYLKCHHFFCLSCIKVVFHNNKPSNYFCGKFCVNFIW